MKSLACAWCGIPIRNIKTTTEGDLLSHSICINCTIEMEIFEIIDISESNDQLPFGTVSIDRQNIIHQFKTNSEILNVDYVEGLIGKNLFQEVIPHISNKNMRKKLGGLRRRKHNGVQEFEYILKKNDDFSLIQIEFSHFVSSGNSAMKLTLVTDEVD